MGMEEAVVDLPLIQRALHHDRGDVTRCAERRLGRPHEKSSFIWRKGGGAGGSGQGNASQKMKRAYNGELSGAQAEHGQYLYTNKCCSQLSNFHLKL